MTRLTLSLYPQLIMEAGDALALVDLVWNMCLTLRRVIGNLKANKDRHQRLCQRVKALQELVLTIKERGPSHIPNPILNALQDIRTTLACAEVMMIKYSQAKGVKGLVKSNSFESKFLDMNQRLNENYLTLSGALQAEHREVLHRVHEIVSGGRPDQEYCGGQVVPPVPMAAPSQASTLTFPVPAPSQAPTPIIPVPVPNMVPSGILTSGIPLPLGHVMSPSPFSVLAPPRPTLVIHAPVPNMIVPPFPPMPSQIVISSTVAPPQARVLGTYTIKPSFFP